MLKPLQFDRASLSIYINKGTPLCWYGTTALRWRMPDRAGSAAGSGGDRSGLEDVGSICMASRFYATGRNDGAACRSGRRRREDEHP